MNMNNFDITTEVSLYISKNILDYLVKVYKCIQTIDILYGKSTSKSKNV